MGTTDFFGRCRCTTAHLRDPHLRDTIVFRQLHHGSSLLAQHVTVFRYRQRGAAVKVHAYGLESVFRVVRCRQREELGQPLLSWGVCDTVNRAQ